MDGARDEVGGVERETLGFLSMDLKQPQRQMNSAERKAALLQRIRAEEATKKCGQCIKRLETSIGAGAYGMDQTTSRSVDCQRQERRCFGDAAESRNEPFVGSGFGGEARTETLS